MERVSIRHGLQHYRLSDMSNTFRCEYSGQEYQNIQMLQLCLDIEQERERESFSYCRELLILDISCIEHWSLEYWTESLTSGIISGSQVLEIVSSSIMNTEVSMNGEDRDLSYEKRSLISIQ